MQGLLDFDVAIEPFADGFRARVVASPAGEAYADFALPFTDTDVENFVLKVGMSIGRGRRQARRIQSDERRLLEEFGDRLFRAAFSGPVRDCLKLSRAVAESHGAGLRIRLRLPGALANVPWEYLYDAQYGFIGLSPETVLVRYLEMPAPVSPFAVSPPLRVLAMVSGPEDLPGLQGEQEWGKLTNALADLAGRGMVQVDRLEAGTLAALQRPLRLREYHVLHFVGHGVYDEAAQDGALALEGADGKTRLVTGRDLGLMIRGHRSLRLVVLNACEGARNARDDPLGGVAQALVRQGIPAVIAMQFEISDPAALVFSRSFYQAIADGLPVDAAMVEARVAMFAEGHEVEWATPVLYLRSPDGRIFAVGPIPDADRQARQHADRQAREDADRQAREDAEQQAREDAEQQAREDADRQAREYAERRDRELAAHYALACTAADAQDWDRALAGFAMITDVDPGYQDVQERAENARKQQQIARWQAEARRLHQAGQWAAVVKAGQRLHALDPAAADPDGLVTAAQAELAATERAGRLDADYETARRHLDAGNWQQALDELERVAQVNPAYRATPALLAQARRHLTDAKPSSKPTTPPREGARASRVLADAERITQSITDASRKESALASIAKALAATDPDRAERIARSLTDAYEKARALIEVAAAALTAGDPDRAARVITDAERTGQSITGSGSKNYTLGDVAKVLAAIDPDRAERIARSITDDRPKAQALAKVAAALAPADSERSARLFTDAERTARSVTNKDDKAWGNYNKSMALGGVAVALAPIDPERAARLFTDAERTAQPLILGRRKSKEIGLTDLACVIARADPDRAARLIADQEREAQAMTETPSGDKTMSLHGIAMTLAASDPDRAERIAQSIPWEGWKAEPLTEVAKTLAATDPDRAERIAWSITPEWRKAIALAAIAKALSGF